MFLLFSALLRALSLRETEAFAPPLQFTYSKQLYFAADHCQYSCASRRDSLLQLDAVSERTQTNEQFNEIPAITTSPDETDSLRTSTGQPHSLKILAEGRVQSTSLSKKNEEHELWQELLNGDENIRHHDSRNVIRSEQEEIANDDTASNQNGEECVSCDSSTEENGSETASSNDPEDASVSDVDVRASLAKSAILRRAGVAGGKTRQSSRSNGRSSLAKTHVNKGRRSANKGSAVGQVLNTVRTAAAGVAGKKNNAAETEDGSDSRNKDLRACGAFNANTPVPITPKMNNAIQSAVSEVLAQPTADELLNPPGMTSMGLLGEVVHEDFPVIPPLPGKFLTEFQARRNSPLISIRSSMPHSPDDTHIANLRLSVFSNFDSEKQRAFRHRSVEVINIRRRRGAVVLVAETPVEEDENHNYLNEMQARIARGHTFGEKDSDNVNLATISKQQQHRTSRLSSKIIIGSVECSHHEFKGTMLGKSRPKGSLMYVTEVAVRPNKRRNGAGAALMKGVDEVAVLRNVETIYLHVDIENKAACAMYERMGYQYLDKREPLYAQFTASLNLHDGAMHGRKHYLMCKQVNKTTWL